MVSEEMAVGSMHGARRFGRRLLNGPLLTRLSRDVLIATGLLLACLVTAHSVPIMSGRFPKPLALILIAADLVIMFSLAAEQLLVVWLFAAPLLQETGGDTHIEHILALGLYTAPPFVVCVKGLLAHGARPRREWLDFLPVFFVALVFASLAITSTSSLRSGAVGTLRDFYQTVALGAVLYYVAGFWRGRSLSVVQISWAVLASAVLQSAMVIVEWRTGWNLWRNASWHVPGDMRATGTFANPEITGAFIGAGLVLGLAVLCWEGPLRLRRVAAGMVVLGLPALYATKTRGPILATLIVAAAVVLLSRRTRIIGIGSLALVGLLLALYWPQIRSSQLYATRIGESQNIQIRLVLQKASINLALQKPIFGWGYNSFDRVKFKVPLYSNTVPVSEALQYTSHDTFLTILVEYGAVGLLLFLVPFVPVMLRAARRARLPAPDRWFFVAGLGVIGVVELNAATVDYRFFSLVPALPWLFLGLMRRNLSATGISG
jgi:O-antigen ligase